MSVHTKFQLPRLPGSKTTSVRLNPILDVFSSWVERSLDAKFQLPRMPGSDSSMVGDKQQKTKQNSVELEASSAPAEAEVGAVAKADQ